MFTIAEYANQKLSECKKNYELSMEKFTKDPSGAMRSICYCIVNDIKRFGTVFLTNLPLYCQFAQTTINMEFPTFPTVSELIERFNDDVYDAIKFCEDELMVLKPISNQKYKKNCVKVQYHNNAVTNLITEYVQSVTGLDTVPEQYREKVFDQACSESGNWYGIYCRLETLIGIFK